MKAMQKLRPVATKIRGLSSRTVMTAQQVSAASTSLRS
jgi:hypothetical protein